MIITITVPDYCKPSYLNYETFVTNFESELPLPDIAEMAITGFVVENACTSLSYTISGNMNLYNINGGDILYYPGTLDMVYYYNLTVTVWGTYGSFSIDIYDNMVYVPPDCEESNIMLMLGIDHDNNQWWHGDNINSYDVSMVLGAEAPCTHVMYSLVNLYDENDLIIQDGTSVIEFARLRQADIDELYVTLIDPEDFVTFSPVPEIQVLHELGITIDQLPNVL